MARIPKIDLIATALLTLVRQIPGTKIHVVDKKKDEYVIKYLSRNEYNVRLFPQGKPSKKKLKTKEPLAFLQTLKINKFFIVNDTLNKNKETVCIYQKS